MPIDLARALAAGRTPSGLAANARAGDPTRTGGIRRRFEREFAARWDRVNAGIQWFIVGSNELGLIANAGRYAFLSNPAKVEAFREWFDAEVNAQLFEGELHRDGGAGRFWGKPLAEEAYNRGLIDATGAIKRGGGRVSEEYIRDALRRGTHAQTLGRIQTRAFEDLVGITDTLADKLGDILGGGLAQGMHPMALAGQLMAITDQIGAYRSRLIARTETIAAYNEAELTTFEEAGLRGVVLRPELMTAEDSRVCAECDALADREWTIQTARGVLPVHPNCRCAWAPVIVNGKEIVL